MIKQFELEWKNRLPYIVANTSGSTGKPKETRLLKSDMIVSAKATNNFFGITSESVVALPLSTDYIAGKMMAVRAWMANCEILELPVSNEINLDRTVDFMCVVPTQIPSVLSKRGFIKKLLIGGAPLSFEQEKEISESGLEAWLGYGMTETCSHVALRRVGGDGTFMAMPGITFSLDCRGCLVIHSDLFSWRTLVTNDIVELKSPVSFIWRGRFDNVINSGGLKLHPEQLEEQFKQTINDLPPFFLIGENDSVLGQRLVMVMENPPYDILKKLKSLINDHRLLPKRVISVDHLPRTSSGKIRRILPEFTNEAKQ